MSCIALFMTLVAAYPECQQRVPLPLGSSSNFSTNIKQI